MNRLFYKYTIPERFLQQTIHKYKSRNIQPILDYAVEHTIDACDSGLNAHKKIQLMKRFPSEHHALKLSSLNFSHYHMLNIMEYAKLSQSYVVVDAEEHNIQHRIKAITDSMVANGFDKHIFTTYQMYKTDMFDNLMEDIREFKRCGFVHNIKLVRGAYLWNDMKLGVLHNSKKETDEMYNEALKMLVKLSNERMKVIFATHNRSSVQLLQNTRNENIRHAFLMGMDQDFYFQNKHLKHMVHVPFGPFNKTYPYLFRRLLENNKYVDQLLQGVQSHERTKKQLKELLDVR